MILFFVKIDLTVFKNFEKNNYAKIPILYARLQLHYCIEL